MFFIISCYFIYTVEIEKKSFFSYWDFWLAAPTIPEVVIILSASPQALCRSVRNMFFYNLSLFHIYSKHWKTSFFSYWDFWLAVLTIPEVIITFSVSPQESWDFWLTALTIPEVIITFSAAPPALLLRVSL